MVKHGILAVVLVIAITGESRAADSIIAKSGDGGASIEFALRPDGGIEDLPHYRVTFAGNEVIGYSRLGIELSGDQPIGGTCKVERTESRVERSEYTQVTGKRSAVTSHAAVQVVSLKETAAPHRQWEIELRAFDDGVAFRYRFPRQAGWDELAITRERTEFRLPAETKAIALPLNGFTTSYEKRYDSMLAKDLPQNWLVGLPLLLECSGGTWAAITEANVNEYAGMYLAPVGNGVLSARLSPRPDQPEVAIRASLPHTSPWRVVMLGDRIGRLVESDIVLNLSDPCAIEDTSWIKTGKTTFPWWNGFYETGVDFRRQEGRFYGS